MKTSILSIGLLSLGSMLLGSESSATTYAGQSCESTSPGKSLSYTPTGASNTSGSSMYISCPITRANDFGTAAASAIIYFVNDGLSKSCFFDNFSIDTGNLGIWTSMSGTTRLVFPTLSPTLQWQPFTINCSLPSGSRVNGYFVYES